MVDIKCFICGSVLFKAKPLDDKGNWAMEPEILSKLAYTDIESFISCPDCFSRNFIVESASPSGHSMFRIKGAARIY
jgi:ribosomal protein S27E